MVKTRPNLKNFLYLLGSGLLIHFTGTVYRIWLARKIGAEGLGIFQMSYPIYRLLSNVATIGLPLALTKWVSEYLTENQYTSIQNLKKWSIRTVLIGSLITTALLFIFATWLSRVIFAEPRLQLALYVIAIAIPFSALSSIYRSYYQGFSLMAPTAISETAEQAAEISIACLGLVYLCSFLPQLAYSIPIAGLVVGEIISLLTLLFFDRSKNSRQHLTNASNISVNTFIPKLDIINYSWPLLLNQIVVAISMSAEAALIPRLLMNTGVSPSHATGMLGILNGMAASVAYFPLIFVLPLATVLSPQISATIKESSLHPIRKKIYLYYLAGLTIGIAGFLIIFFNSTLLAALLYGSLVSAPLIRLLVISLPFSSLAILNITILGAIGASSKILLLSLWGVGLKTALFLVFIHFYGINGAAWAITITQIFIFLASLAEIRSALPRLKLDVKNYPRWLQQFRSRLGYR